MWTVGGLNCLFVDHLLYSCWSYDETCALLFCTVLRIDVWPARIIVLREWWLREG